MSLEIVVDSATYVPIESRLDSTSDFPDAKFPGKSQMVKYRASFRFSLVVGIGAQQHSPGETHAVAETRASPAEDGQILAI